MSKMPSPYIFSDLTIPRANITARDLLKASADKIPPSTVSGDASGLAQTVTPAVKLLKGFLVGNPEDAFNSSKQFGGQTQVGPVMGPSITLPWGDRTSGAIDAGLAALPLFGGIMGGVKPYFSALTKTLEERAPARATGEQILNILKKGSKAEELQWSGLDELLSADPAKMWTKDELLAHVKTNLPAIHEQMMGAKGTLSPDKINVLNDRIRAAGYEPLADDQIQAIKDGYATDMLNDFEARLGVKVDDLRESSKTYPKFTQYTLPGGENHRELVVTMPPTGKVDDHFDKWLSEAHTVGSVLDNLSDSERYGVMHVLGTQGINYEDPMSRAVFEQLPEGVRDNIHKDYIKARQSFTNDEFGINTVDNIRVRAITQADIDRHDIPGHDFAEPGHFVGFDANGQAATPPFEDEDDARDAVAQIAEMINEEDGPQSSSVYNVPFGHQYGDPALDTNRLFHARFNDRTTVAGERALHMDELQSDWHQAGRKQGYATTGSSPLTEEEKLKFAHYLNDTNQFDDDNIFEILREKYKPEEASDEDIENEIIHMDRDERAKHALSIIEANRPDPLHVREIIGRDSTVPDAPFKNTWHELGMKRALQEAAAGDYDRLTWTTGQQQADRYSLANHVDKLEYDPVNKILKGSKDGRTIVNKTVEPGELPQYIGGEAAQKLLATEHRPSLASKYGDAVELFKKSRSDEYPDGLELNVKHNVPLGPYTVGDGDFTPHEFKVSEPWNTHGMYREFDPEKLDPKLKAVLDDLHKSGKEHIPWNTVTPHTLEGDGLTVGGEGMKGFYDKMLPDFVNKYGKKWGVKAEKVKIGGDHAEQWVDVTRPHEPQPVTSPDHMDDLIRDWKDKQYEDLDGVGALSRLQMNEDKARAWLVKMGVPDVRVDEMDKADVIDKVKQMLSGTGGFNRVDMIKRLEKDGFIKAIPQSHEVWSVKITPQMKADLLEKGQPMYSLPLPAVKKEDDRKTLRMLPAHRPTGAQPQ